MSRVAEHNSLPNRGTTSRQQKLGTGVSTKELTFVCPASYKLEPLYVEVVSEYTLDNTVPGTLPFQSADYAPKDGNHYVFSYNPSTREATLIEGEVQYKGDAMIPSMVKYEGMEYSVTEIGDDAFHGCAELTSATLPTSIKKIGSHAFAQSGLSTIDIPNSEIKIGDYAFVDTPWFTSHPDGMIYISNTAFRYKGEMPEGTDFIFKDGITDISEMAF